jgi:hypothetical protein
LPALISFYEAPQVVTYDVVTWETSLFDAKTNQMLWAGTTETFSPEDIKKQAREFASVVVKALAQEGLIPK